MKLSTQLLAFFSLLPLALAGQNCKCQDPSGKGPQWNYLTELCCKEWDVIKTCVPYFAYYPGPNNQCSASNTNCLNSGAFNECCKRKGRDFNLNVPGAFCWN